MFGKLRNYITTAVDQIGPNLGITPGPADAIDPPRSGSISSSGQAAGGSNSGSKSADRQRSAGQTRGGDEGPPPKFRYTRPYFLQLTSDDEIQVSADHTIRPIIVPRDISKMPWNSGYAETINAGKSTRNEDEASIYRSTLRAVINDHDISMKVADMMPSTPAYPNQLPIGQQRHPSTSRSTRQANVQRKLLKVASQLNSNSNTNGPQSSGLVPIPVNGSSVDEEELSTSIPKPSDLPLPTSESSDSLASETLSAADLLSPTEPLPLQKLSQMTLATDEDPLSVAAAAEAAEEVMAEPTDGVMASSSSGVSTTSPPATGTDLTKELNNDNNAAYQTPPTSPGVRAIMEESIPFLIYSLFDGHAGYGVSVAASNTLHRIIHDKLQSIADLLIAFGLQEMAENKRSRPPSGTNNKGQMNGDVIPEEVDDDLETTDSSRLVKNGPSSSLLSRHQDGSLVINQDAHLFGDNVGLLFLPAQDKIVTVDNLIIGAIESAFWEMDKRIAEDKKCYKMSGGCTVLVSLFILGKLYVANAGDSRAIISRDAGNQVIPMSFDFTPESERQRIKYLGLLRPEYLGKDFTQLEFVRRPMRRDLGKKILYRDAYMTGWAYKTITVDDLKFPLIYGEGKRSRVLATIGVTRGFGDHELKAQATNLDIKPFLTPQPEVKVFEIAGDETLTDEDVIIMGTDGLWDVISNERAAETVARALEQFPAGDDSRQKYRFITAAQDLVMQARGKAKERGRGWKTLDNRPASVDDISVFVVPLKPYRDEFAKWKQARHLVKQQASHTLSN